jgi:hypothetical protein
MAQEDAVTNTCKGCGRKILWARTEDGKAIPLDAVAPVYEVAAVESAERGDSLVARRAKECFVSHFVTCPKRDEFRKPKKAEPDSEVW